MQTHRPLVSGVYRKAAFCVIGIARWSHALMWNSFSIMTRRYYFAGSIRPPLADYNRRIQGDKGCIAVFLGNF